MAKATNNKTSGAGQSPSSSKRKHSLRSAGNHGEPHNETPPKKVKTPETTKKTNSALINMRSADLSEHLNLKKPSQNADQASKKTNKDKTNEEIKYAEETSNVYPQLSTSFFNGHTVANLPELPYTDVNSLIEALVESKGDLKITKVEKSQRGKSKTEMKIVPLACSICSLHQKNTRHLLTHLVENHFPEHLELLESCGLVNPEVQKSLDSAVRKQQNDSHFQKTFKDSENFVLKCPLAKPVLKYLFEAPIVIQLGACPTATALVKVDVKDDNGKEHAVYIKFDGFLDVQRNSMKQRFVLRMKDCKDRRVNFCKGGKGEHYEGIKLEDEIQTWSREWKLYFATQLAFTTPNDNKLFAEEIKEQNFETRIETHKGHRYDTEIPCHITGWNKINVNGTFVKMDIDD